MDDLEAQIDSVMNALSRLSGAADRQRTSHIKFAANRAWLELDYARRTQVAISTEKAKT